MKRAYVGIREQPFYRRDAFVSGLKSLGYDVRIGAPPTFDADTIYCCWNRYQQHHDYCKRLEKAGGIALIAENGYVGPGGVSPVLMEHRPVYALARGYHNDSTVIPEGGPERWDALGVELAPWRVSGEHVLVCPNRSFGTPGRAMPPDWANKVVNRLQKVTKRPIRVRTHPGNDPPRKPLAEDLAGAWACVIWSSSAGVHALVAGIPVFCEAPRWICKGGNGEATEGVETDIRFIDVGPRLGMFSRLSSLSRLAHAQYSVDEISSGAAFRAVLQREAVPC